MHELPRLFIDRFPPPQPATHTLKQPDIQAINAPFSALITAMMICRLMLNLHNRPDQEVLISFDIQTRLKLPETYLGNLGEDLDVETVDHRVRTGTRDRRTLRKERDYELSTIYSSRATLGQPMWFIPISMYPPVCRVDV